MAGTTPLIIQVPASAPIIRRISIAGMAEWIVPVIFFRSRLQLTPDR